jgi:hypothetical protein
MQQIIEQPPVDMEFDLLIAAASLAAAPEATAEQVIYFRRMWETYVAQHFYPDVRPLCARVAALGKDHQRFAIELRKARERSYPRPKRSDAPTAPQRFRPGPSAGQRRGPELS